MIIFYEVLSLAALLLFWLDHQQGGAELGVAINQRHQEGVLVQGTMAGEVDKMEVKGSTTNPEETLSTDPLPVKRGDIEVQGSRVTIIFYQENQFLRFQH